MSATFKYVNTLDFTCVYDIELCYISRGGTAADVDELHNNNSPNEPRDGYMTDQPLFSLVFNCGVKYMITRSYPFFNITDI